MSLSIRRVRLGSTVAATLLAAFAIGSTALVASADAASTTLVGTFKIAAGTKTAGKPAGSYFRMAFPGGSGNFSNPYSKAGDQTYTPLSPGTDGGITTGLFQGAPSPAFNTWGGSRAGKIIVPTNFGGLAFGLATFQTPPGGGTANLAPVFKRNGSVLTAQVTSLYAGWNSLYFNQGTPKPGQTTPLATGTYNATKKTYVLNWTSPIAGGPFNGFSGVWHLEGSFKQR